LEDSILTFHSNNIERLYENSVTVVTFFGWSIQGCHEDNNKVQLVFTLVDDKDKDFDVTKFWSLESISFSEIRYSATLPWRLPKFNLHSYRKNAEACLYSLVSRLRRVPERMSEYNNGIQELVKTNVLQKS